MSDIENAYYRGKRIGDMSREELLACTAYLADQLKRYQTPAMATAIGYGQVEMLRRGLG